LNGHFIDASAIIPSICVGNCPAQEWPHAIRSNTGVPECASAHGVALFFRGHRRLLLIFLFKTNRDHQPDRSTGRSGERTDMNQAYIIEIESRTAGIVARDDRGYRFFSSDRIFDGLEGREFRSARDAERAARTLLQQRSHLFAIPSTVSAF